MSSYDDFFEALGFRESSGRYHTDKDDKPSTAYIGKFQMGELTLTDVGYYKVPRDSHGRRISSIPLFGGEWTGKDGVHSKQDFLNTPRAQERAIRFMARRNWAYIRHYGGLQSYVGQYIKGIRITESGMLGAAHLKSIGSSAEDIQTGKADFSKAGLLAFLESGGEIDGVDQLNTHVSEYLKLFAGYQTPFDLNPTRSHYQQEFSEFMRTGRQPTINPAVDNGRTIIMRYIWRSRDDSKVRLGHQQNDDKIFALEGDPQPEGGRLPGTDFGCRCYAEWILDTKYPIEP